MGSSMMNELTQKLIKLRAYAVTAKTAIYNEDAMTAIELAGQTACKVNECVDAINSLIEIIETLISSNGLEYNPDTEELTI